MAVDASLLETVFAGCLGLALSVPAERLLRPRPSLNRPASAWAAHLTVWCGAYGLAVLLTGRPWCAMLAVTAMLMTLVLVNNAKYENLREPFIVQDYDYFLDTVRYPRLFLPFLGIRGFLGIAAFIALALTGWLLETPPETRFALNGQLGGAVAALALAFALARRLKTHAPQCRLDPEQDVRTLGLVGSLWAYAVAQHEPPAARSPFAARPLHARENPPHLIAVQGESFFDARTLHKGVRPDVLAAFDVLRAEALLSGPLSVPAWGANTVRTEFAFLTGVAPETMGAHRFNPYRAVARGWPVHSLPLFLKSLGYRTVCIHPYRAGFYGRDRVLRRLGFDAFLDITAFAGARRAGPHVADEAVGERIAHVLRLAADPTFVFAVTMESHGPLHMEKPRPEADGEIYADRPPDGCEEFGIYLHHLRNADTMLRMLRETLRRAGYPASLCLYGDHVPIMPSAYRSLGTPEGLVPYICWSNRRAYGVTPRGGGQGTAAADPPLAVHELASRWLDLLR